MRPQCNWGDDLLISGYSKSYNAFIDYGQPQTESSSCFHEFLLEITPLDASNVMPEEEDSPNSNPNQGLLLSLVWGEGVFSKTG